MNISALKTLPAREYRSGFGEIIKHGLILDRELTCLLHLLLRHGHIRISFPHRPQQNKADLPLIEGEFKRA